MGHSLPGILAGAVDNAGRSRVAQSVMSSAIKLPENQRSSAPVGEVCNPCLTAMAHFFISGGALDSLIPK